MKKKKKKYKLIGKCALTGKFLSVRVANNRPATAYVQKVRINKKKKK